MADIYQGGSEMQSRDERLVQEGVTADSDQPSPVYHATHGRTEADVEHIGNTYPMVVTAHFPDRTSADRALEQIQRYRLEGSDPVQVFEKEPPDLPGDDNDPGLAPGEIAILIQLVNEAESFADELVRICQEAGARHARSYPAKRIGHI